MISSEIEQIAWTLFCEVLGQDANSPILDIQRRRFSPWDSLAHVNLLLSMDTLFGTDLASSPRQIESFGELLLALRNVQPKEIQERKPESICFIGNCHSLLVYQALASVLRKMGGKPLYQLRFHHVDHILQWCNAHRHLSSEDRVRLFIEQAGELARGFRRFIVDADRIFLSQIFQLEGRANVALLEALRMEFPTAGQLVFLPVPLPAEPGLFFSPESALFTGSQRPDRTLVEENCPGAIYLDTSPAMDLYYQENGVWSFMTRWTGGHNGSTFEIDLTHPQPLFWEFLACHRVLPFLGQNVPGSIPEGYGQTLETCYQNLCIAADDSQTFDEIAGAPAPSHWRQEVIKRIWYARPDLRFNFLCSCFRTLGDERLWECLQHQNWCNIDDFSLDPDQVPTLESHMLLATGRFQDLHQVKRCFLAIALLHHQSWKSGASSETAEWCDQYLYTHESFFNRWLRLLGSASSPQEPWVSDRAKGIIVSSLEARLDLNRPWILYGAGPLAALILQCLKSDQYPILASGIQREWGQTLKGCMIEPIQAISSRGIDQILVATRSWYYPDLEPYLSDLFPNASTRYYFEKGFRETDLKTAPQSENNIVTVLHRRIKQAHFRLTWIFQDRSERTYDFKSLLRWGKAILEQVPNIPGPGEILPFALPTSPVVYALFYACIWDGIIPVVLSYPTSRRDPADYQKQIAAVVSRLEARVIICDQSLAAVLQVSGTLFTLNDVFEPLASLHTLNPRPIGPQAFAFLQHSSGTTGIQKTVAVTHFQLMQQLNAYGQSLDLIPEDVIGSWLPFYHDMGLITSLLGPIVWDVPVVACNPVTWIEQPALILHMISLHRVTLSWWPNFTFALLAWVIPAQKNIDLSSLRMVINCSEPVTFESVSAFLEKAQAIGFDPGALAACYAMAETTFAVTQTSPGKSIFTLPISQDNYAKGIILQDPTSAKILVSSGEFIDGAQLNIVGPDGDLLPDGVIGEIYIQSTSLFDGYLVDKKTDRSCFGPWGYQSGDLGFLWRKGGSVPQLFVTGRRKDLIIIAGENYYPQDFEQLAETVPGVKAGRSVAFGLFDQGFQTEKLLVAVEVMGDSCREVIAGEIADLISGHYNLDARVLVFGPQFMIKSSSGKISRNRSKQKVLDHLGTLHSDSRSSSFPDSTPI